MAYIFKTTDDRSKLMRKIKSHNTKPELILRKELWKLGYRYRINSNKLPGKPDIVFSKYKICVFVDGEFWHGKDWEIKAPKIKSNRDYWIPKIERNMKRDVLNNNLLVEQGWLVLRFWSRSILTDTEECVQKILKLINSIPQ